MKHEDRPTHEAVKALFAALEYKPAQIAKVLNISAKAAQLKSKEFEYSKFTASDLEKLLAFLDQIAAVRAAVVTDLQQQTGTNKNAPE